MVDGEQVQGGANTAVYAGISSSTRALLDSVILHIETGVLPLAGGLYEQPAEWYNALLHFRDARGYWAGQRTKVQQQLRGLGAYGK